MQKRVLAFVPEFPVTTETFISRELSALAGSGRFDLEIVAIKKGSAKVSENLQNITHFHKLSILDILRGKLLALRHPTRAFYAWKTVGFARPYLYLKTLGYAAVFSKFKPEVIFAHFLSTPSTIALGVSIILDIPLVISGHARDVLEYPDIPDQKVKLAKFITICNKNAFEKLSGENIKLIYHGVDAGEIETGVNIQKLTPPMILSVGRYVEKKGLEYLIRAAKELKDAGREFSLVLVGGGPLEPRLKEVVKALGLEKEVVLAGEQPFEDVRTSMHMASVYVQPAINAVGGDADGVPNTLIEAALADVPIVTTDAGSIRDFLSEENAILVSQKNPTELAQGISKLLDDAALAEKLSTNAKHKAQEMFDATKNINQLADLLEEAAK